MNSLLRLLLFLASHLLHLQASGLYLPRFCVVCDNAGHHHEIQRRRREQGHQAWEFGGGAQAFAAAGILLMIDSLHGFVHGVEDKSITGLG